MARLRVLAVFLWASAAVALKPTSHARLQQHRSPPPALLDGRRPPRNRKGRREDPFRRDPSQSQPQQPQAAIPNLADLVVASHARLQQGGDAQQDPPLFSQQSQAPRREQPPASPRMRTPGNTVSAWLLFGKAPIRDQMTLELAVRVSAMVRLLATRGPPDMICFCGGEADGLLSPTPIPAPSDPLNSASLCYHYFVTAAEAQRIDISGVRFIVENHREAREGVLATAIALRARVRDRGSHTARTPHGVCSLFSL